jgi:hypothetical protein
MAHGILRSMGFMLYKGNWGNGINPDKSMTDGLEAYRFT